MNSPQRGALYHIALYRIFAVSILLLIGAGFARASEIDDTTPFYDHSPDSLPVLNMKVQEAIDHGLSGIRDCDFASLGKRISSQLVSLRYFSGAFEVYAIESPLVVKHRPQLATSIYKNTAFAHSIIGTLYGIDPTLSLNGIRVGTDKLGHFIDHGHKLYEMRRQGKSVSQLVKHMIDEEDGGFGLITTGVKSYADMAANFDGFRFWMNIYGYGENNYFVCDNGRVRQARAFSFAEYISLSWNEAVNCNDFSDSGFATQYQRNAQALETASGKRFVCPILPMACAQIREHYAQWLSPEELAKVISPHCR